jgi:chromosomal replication initiation ATPase DnaA
VFLIRGVASQHGRQITELACQKLAAAFPKGLIQLRGMMAQLVIVSPEGQTIDTAAVRNLLREAHSADRPEIKTISNRVAKYFGLKVADLKSGTRRHSIVEARSIAMVLARQLTGESLKKIGAFFGGRDHTTVMHAIQSIESKQQKDPALREAMAQLKRIILRQGDK